MDLIILSFFTVVVCFRNDEINFAKLCLDEFRKVRTNFAGNHPDFETRSFQKAKTSNAYKTKRNPKL